MASTEGADSAAAETVSGAEKSPKIITLTIQNERALADLATAINAAHQRAERALRDGLLNAIRAGELLLLAKRQVDHGQWENWLQANVPFQARTARAYIQLARLDPEKRQRVADLPLRGALSAIRERGTPKPVSAPDSHVTQSAEISPEQR